MSVKNIARLLVVVAVLVLISACAGQPQVVEKVETVEVEKIVTVEVEKEVEKIVTVEVEVESAAPEEAAEEAAPTEEPAAVVRPTMEAIALARRSDTSEGFRAERNSPRPFQAACRMSSTVVSS